MNADTSNGSLITRYENGVMKIKFDSPKHHLHEFSINMPDIGSAIDLSILLVLLQDGYSSYETNAEEKANG